MIECLERGTGPRSHLVLASLVDQVSWGLKGFPGVEPKCWWNDPRKDLSQDESLSVLERLERIHAKSKSKHEGIQSLGEKTETLGLSLLDIAPLWPMPKVGRKLQLALTWLNSSVRSSISAFETLLEPLSYLEDFLDTPRCTSFPISLGAMCRGLAP